MIFSQMRRVAIVAPHPDDEILGCGGTMARLVAQGASVHVVVVTRGHPPDFDEALVCRIREETLKSHTRIGVEKTHFLDLPAARLDQVAQSDVNRALGDALIAIDPDTLFVPFLGDIHLDHQISFNAAMVYARPRSAAGPKLVLAYETLSETNWWAPGVTPGFLPNVFIDITGQIEAKIAAFEAFSTQVKESPDERSIDTIRALATLRGATVHRRAAEGFMLIRQIG